MIRAMFVTVTLSPAVDQTVLVAPPLALGGVHRGRESHRVPGGKGINVARMLARNGKTVRAGGILGEDVAPWFASSLSALGVQCDFLQVPNATRTNLMISDGAGRELKVNQPSFPDLDFDGPRLERYCTALASPGDVAVLCGSLPQRFPQHTWRLLVERLNARGVRTVLDTSGEALAEGVRGVPAVIKPNREEFESIAGSRIEDEEALVRTAKAMAGESRIVIVSAGSEGAFFVGRGTALRARLAAPVNVVDTTGAGDALLGQFCADFFEGRTPEQLTEALVSRAVAAGAAAIEIPGSEPPALERVLELARRVEIRRC